VTLADLIPSLRSSLPHPLEPWLWPASTQHLPGGDLSVGGSSLSGVADRCGTPTQVLDLDEVRGRCTDYRHAFYDAEVAYAGRALLTVEIVRIVAEAGLSLTVSSSDELEIAERGQFPMERVILHGSDRPLTLLNRARALGVGRIVVDSIEQIEASARICSAAGPQRVLLRVAPHTSVHSCMATGQEYRQHGLSIASGAAAHAVRRIVAETSLTLVGFHCQLGSQITSVTPYEEAGRQMLALRAAVAAEHALALPELNLGGGHAIAYHPGDVPLWPWKIAAALRQMVREGSSGLTPSEPRITVEPGRAIAGPCGVTVYRVTQVNRIGDRVWLTVDGGLRDYLSPHQRGRSYTARLLGRLSSARDEHLTVVGRNGDAREVLIEDALLAADTGPGDLLAVPATGAHRRSASSLQVTAGSAS
jgi:diaminopimelate decarboxylase